MSLNSMLGTIACERNPQYVAKEKIFQLDNENNILSKCPWWIDGGRTGKQNLAKSDAKWCIDKLESDYGLERIPRLVVDLDRGLMWRIT